MANRKWQARPNSSGSWDVVEIMQAKGDWEEVQFIAIARSEVDAHDIAAVKEMKDALQAITDCFGLGLSVRKFVAQVEPFMRAGREALAKAGAASGRD